MASDLGPSCSIFRVQCALDPDQLAALMGQRSVVLKLLSSAYVVEWVLVDRLRPVPQL